MIQVADNFNYRGKKPNFDRDSFDTLQSMKSYSDNNIDEGHISYCIETGKHYKYNSNNDIDSTTGKFREFIEGVLPDEEDITSNNDDKLKFADRKYNPEKFSGKGYKILRKNIQDGKNILSQSMINQQNTVYEIRYDYDLDNQEITIPEGSTLKFNGGSLSNGTVMYNNCLLEGDVKVYRAKGKIRNKEVYVSYYGAKGDGITDDSEAIQNSIEALPSSNFILIFDKGVYIQGDGTNPSYPIPYSGNKLIGKAIYFSFKEKSNFKIIGNWARIVAHENNSCIVNNKGFEFINCNHGIIESLIYDGNKNQRKPMGGDPGEYNDQNNFAIKACQFLTFIDCESLNSVMDGFIDTQELIGETVKFSSNNSYIRCKMINSYRQGLSIVNSHFGYCQMCEFSESGKTYGTSPMAGVDAEQGYTHYADRGQKNWLFEKCKFENNYGSGLSLHWGTYNSSVVGSYFIKNDESANNGIYIPKDSQNLTINNEISNCYLENVSVELLGGATKFINNIIKSTDKNGIKLTIGRYSHDTNSTQDIIENNTIICDLSNITINDNCRKLQTFFFGDAIVRNNTFINPYNVAENKPAVALNGSQLKFGAVFNGNKFILDKDIEVPTFTISLPKFLRWRDVNYFDSNINIGTELPDYTGYNYTDVIFDKNKNKLSAWDGEKWITYSPEIIDAKVSGPYSSRPISNDIKVGYSYYCTDKQTTEGSRDGIMIYYAGDNTWVDALGRIVS